MPIFNHHLLQKSIYEALSGDESLAGMVSGVFDHVPQASAFPYISLGEIGVRDWSTKTTAGAEYQLVFHVWSREGGRKQSANIMEQLYALLHDGDLSVEDNQLVLLRFISSQIELEKDGVTYHGVMRFQALLQAIA